MFKCLGITATQTLNTNIIFHILIDFVKVELINSDVTYFEQHPLLEFQRKYNTKTSELSIISNAFYKGLEFKIYDITEKTPYKRITIEGSLHKYWNNGAHNFNDFGINEIVEVRKDLKELFNIEFKNCILKQLEIGVNILPPVPTKKILRHCFLHKTNQLKSIYTNDEGNYIQSKNQRHFIKLYDKRTHYKNKGFDIDNDIFRIEKKYSKMVELNSLGIYNLSDLIKHDLRRFKQVLIKLWSDVLFYDWTVLDGSKYQNTYSNINYWLNLSENQYSNFKYHKRNLNKIIGKNPNNIKNKIVKTISNKVDILNTKTTQINPLYIELKTIV